jgi:hypothetical protein
MAIALSRHDAVVEYLHRGTGDELWLDINVNGAHYATLGPFETAGERQRMHDGILETMRSLGAEDLPIARQ